MLDTSFCFRIVHRLPSLIWNCHCDIQICAQSYGLYYDNSVDSCPNVVKLVHNNQTKLDYRSLRRYSLQNTYLWKTLVQDELIFNRSFRRYVLFWKWQIISRWNRRKCSRLLVFQDLENLFHRVSVLDRCCNFRYFV